MMRKSVPPADGERFYHGYELLEWYKTGGMSQAYKARSLHTGDTVFLKRVRVRADKDRHALDRELQIYEKLRGQPCNHILRVLDLIADDDYRAIVTEYAEGGDLEGFVRHHGRGAGLPPPLAREVALELAGALQELHAFEIVHRDLKPGNILSTGNRLKLSDFGIAKNTAAMLAKISFKQFGSPGYAAPEQLAGAHAHASADIYSFGKVLAFLLTGRPELDAMAPGPWRNLALQCAYDAPDLRPSAAEVAAGLEKMPR